MPSILSNTYVIGLQFITASTYFKVVINSICVRYALPFTIFKQRFTLIIILSHAPFYYWLLSTINCHLILFVTRVSPSLVESVRHFTSLEADLKFLVLSRINRDGNNPLSAANPLITRKNTSTSRDYKSSK